MKRIQWLSLALVVCCLAACGAGTDAAIATGVAQTLQISQLETAAAAPAQTQAVAETPTSAQAASVQVTTSRDVNMRAGDSSAYGVMTVIPGGQTIEVLGANAAGTWLQVSYRNAIGWMSADFITGDVPANLPLATPSAQPSGGGGGNNTGGGGNNSGGGGGNSGNVQDFTLVLSADNTDNKSISGEVPANVTHRITVRVDNLSGPVEVDIAFQCDTSNPEYVQISAPGADDNTICNNNWSHQVSPGTNYFTVSLNITQGNPVRWTLIANVSP